MKDLWILTIQTSLPDTCYSHAELKKRYYAFASFEKARDMLRQELFNIAFSNNAMFDGNGKLVQLENYITHSYSAEGAMVADGVLTTRMLITITDILQGIFMGENITPNSPEGYFSDWSIEVKLKDNTIEFCGKYAGPSDGYDPVLNTNMLSMQEEKDYYLYINDWFGQYGNSAELYIDLKKVEVNL